MQQDSLRGLLVQLFAPYHSNAADRFTVTGGDIAIDDRAATPLSLLFHELATNASKYGALSTSEGRVTIHIIPGSETAQLIWREDGGPRIAAPAETIGFGSQLIELSAVRQLGGTVARTWRPEGLEVTIGAPMASFSRAMRPGG